MQSSQPVYSKPKSGIWLFSFVIVTALWTMPAKADSPVERGRAVVEKWCRVCHVRNPTQRRPDMGPPFQDIVKRPGRTASYFRAFLDEDHFPMTTFRLFDYEKDEVVAYLMSLKVK